MKTQSVNPPKIIYDIQRHAAEQQYFVYLNVNVITASQAPYVKNYSPNINFDCGSRAAALWLDRQRLAVMGLRKPYCGSVCHGRTMLKGRSFSVALIIMLVPSVPLPAVQAQQPKLGYTLWVAQEADVTGLDPSLSMGLQAYSIVGNLFNCLLSICAELNYVPQASRSNHTRLARRQWCRKSPGASRSPL